MVINTYNESNLHLALKKLYALEFNGRMEVRLDDTDWICDIIDEDGNAIEIQTANLSALTEKVEYLLKTGRKVKIVHSILVEKYIELYDGQGKLVSRKKSPKKATIYDSLRGMTKICPLLTEENCTLEILFVKIAEMRRLTEEPVQLENKSRKHLKTWVPIGKRLEDIISKKRMNAEDFLELTCLDYSQNFRKCDVQKAIKNARNAKTARWAPILVWILLKMNLIQIVEEKGRSKIYSASSSFKASSRFAISSCAD
ncbi:MAG: hypothetical protein KBT11_00555 [Treponema sp.]|nr:hypothetical protein [Candidatus Treponema equifaecale]